MGIGRGHKAGAVCEDAPDLEFSYLSYGKHNLHRIGIWEPAKPVKPSATYWIMCVFLVCPMVAFLDRRKLPWEATCCPVPEKDVRANLCP